MAGDAEVFLNLVELGGLNRHKGVLLTVDGLGLQGGEHLAKGHGHSITSQGFEGVEKDVVLHHPNLHAVKVFGPGHRPLAVGQVTKTIFPVGQVDQAGVFEFFVEVGAGRAVQHDIGFFLIGKQKRQVKGTQLFHNADQRRARGAHHLLGTSAQCLGGRQVTTGRAAPEGVDLDLATRLGIEHLLHALDAQAYGVVFIDAVGELDGALGKLGESRSRDQQGSGHQGRGEGSAFEHVCLL